MSHGESERRVSTIYDVAKEAGVSPKTVSRVLNADAPVGRETRQLVEAAIRKLDYVPSNAARMMRSNKSGLIGLITGALSQKLEPMEPTGLPDLYIVQGIQQVMAGSGKTLMIADTGGAQDKVSGLVQTFVQHRVEALIYVADHHKEVSLGLEGTDCPLLLVNCFDAKGTPAILPDDEKCQFDLVTDLIHSGHRRIAFLTLDPQMAATPLRTRGYRRALESAGLPLDPALVLQARLTDEHDDGRLLLDALRSVLSLPERPSVICFGNDEVALRAYGILRSRGLRIPEDISVAGFDNYRAIAETLYPPLTTVELPYQTMGRHAGEQVLAMIDGKFETTANPLIIDGPVHWRSSVTALTSVTPLRRSLGRNT